MFLAVIPVFGSNIVLAISSSIIILLPTHAGILAISQVVSLAGISPE
jgi:hypothetical protein